jgi:hypothetical protein
LHLFWECPFASKCWDFICPPISKGLPVLEALSHIKDKLKVPFYIEIIILASWSIWIIRNNKIFENTRPTFSIWKAIYYQELKLVVYRIKKKYESDFKAWIQNREH